jgi:16S rRNA (guanine1207-N2)-methyltransferase
MSNHYYSENPTVAHKRNELTVTLMGRQFRFVSDAGVFSREGIDFGSRLLIETMEILPTDHVLDVGCGYGVIGVVAATIATEGRVTMVDINERALKLAEENLMRNQVTNAKVLKSNLFAELDQQRFDKIITNPPIRAGKQVVHQIFEEAIHYLRANGQLWLVIQKKQGAPSAIKKLEQLFSEVTIQAKEKGYYIICAHQNGEHFHS